MNEKGNEYKIHMIRINNFENICFSKTIRNFESDKIHAKNEPEQITTLIPLKVHKKNISIRKCLKNVYWLVIPERILKIVAVIHFLVAHFSEILFLS